MLLVVVMALLVASVPLAGGRLGRLTEIRFRALWVLTLALVVKFSLILLFAKDPSALHGAVHVSVYLIALYFLFVNRHLPGLGVVTLGGLLNLAAIATNGGVMPASEAAFATAGLTVGPGEFSNSAPIADPNLGFLGDIFATPSSWPFANVFSIGDICILLGIAVAVHRICGSRLVPSGSGQFMGLVANRNFMRVWTAQGISNLGDWVYTLAVTATVAARGGGPHTLAILIVVQVAPGAVAGALGGPLIDRFSRRRLMILADGMRALAVGSLLLSSDPSMLHMYSVAAFLGLCGSVFQPSLQASLPNLVPKERLVAANAMVSATFNIAVLAGPVIGGLLVAHLGPRPAFSLNALSFLVSAWFILRAHVPHRNRDAATTPALRGLVEGVRYAMGTPLVRGALLVIGLVILAASLRTPLEPVFVLQDLSLAPEALGLVVGSWGLGMLLGSIAAPAASRRWQREQLLVVAISMVGVAVFMASRVYGLPSLLFLWVLGGMANGIGSVAFDSLLQERTPDRFRGRVMAASEAVFQISFLVGVGASGWLGSHLGVRPTFVLSGMLLVATAMVCRRVMGVPRPKRAAVWPPAVPRNVRAAVEKIPLRWDR